MELHLAFHLRLSEATPSLLDLIVGVLVHHIEFKSVSDQQILVAVQIDIDENGSPRPVRGGHPGHERRLHERPIRPAEEQRVPVKLRTLLNPLAIQWVRTIPHQLRHPLPVLPRQHIDHEEIIVPIPIDIAKINAHRGPAGMTELQLINRAKRSLPGIDPDAIRRRVVIADVQVGTSIAVDVAKHHRQPPITIRRNRRSLLVGVSARLELDRLEVSLAVVAIEPMHLRQFAHFPIRQRLEAPFPLRRTRRFAVHLRHLPLVAAFRDGEAGRRIRQMHLVDEMRAVKIEVAVPIDVRQR